MAFSRLSSELRQESFILYNTFVYKDPSLEDSIILLKIFDNLFL